MTAVRTVDADVRAFASTPAEFFGHSWYAMHHVPADQLRGLQLSALRMRFAELRDAIPVLATMADESAISAIESLDDVVPLLFQHSVYKSYPVSLLIKNKFTALTCWLDRLTTADLRSVDVSGCDSIDSWLEILDTQTDLRVMHTSGTAGMMSFLPRSTSEWDQMYAALRCGLFQFSDPLGDGRASPRRVLQPDLAALPAWTQRDHADARDGFDGTCSARRIGCTPCGPGG